MIRYIQLLAFCFAITACGGSDDTSPAMVLPSPENTDNGEDTKEEEKYTGPIADYRGNDTCATPENLALATIEDLTRWINALPKPTSLPCLVSSLPRPLYTTMTFSGISAQPALGRENPRIFFIIDDLIISVVPQSGSRFNDAENKDQLEVAQITGFDGKSFLQSIKGEYLFPYTEEVSLSEPYAHILLEETLTICSGCHAEEVVVDTIDNVAVTQSRVIDVDPSKPVAISALQLEQQRCQSISDKDAYRCAMLDAIFNHGEILDGEFPEGGSRLD